MVAGTYVTVVWLSQCSSQYSMSHLLNHIVALGIYISYGYLFSKLLFSAKTSDKKE